MITRRKTQTKTAAVLALALAGGTLIPAAQAAIQVQLNGEPLNTSVAPVKIGNRTVVPMRDIFEALGATVIWDPNTMGITAHKDSTTVELAINNRRAAINGRTVNLDQPATLWRGRTMVPLRFVSEAMGADVKWNDAMQLVSITTASPIASGAPSTVIPGVPTTTPTNVTPSGVTPSGSAVAGVRYISVPSGSVIPVVLDQSLSSGTTRVGEGFTASVMSQRLGDSEFPAGTKIEGRVIEARPRQGDNPGVLDLDFRSALLPDGTRVPLRGGLISLDENSVISDNGRVVAKENKQSTGDRLKIVGIGAAAGFVIGKVLDTNTTISTVLGAAGGYLYSRTRDKNRAAEAALSQGTKLGVRLSEPVTYADTTGYAPERENFLRTSLNQSVMGVPLARATYDTPYQPPANEPEYAPPAQPAYQPPTQPAYQPPTQPAYQPPASQPYYPPATQPAYQPPAYQPPAYQPPASQPYYPPATQPAYQPPAQPPATQPTYPGYANTLPPPATVTGDYPTYAYPTQPSTQPPIDLGQPAGSPYAQPAYPTQPYPGQPYPAQPYPGQPAQPYPQPRSEVAGYRTIRIPANVVVPVTLDQDISSATARVGQAFTATVVSERMGDSEFPGGTKIEGTVIEAKPRQGDQPGVLDLDFRTALLPDGTRVPLNAQLISLDDKDLTETRGRIVAKGRNKQSTGDRLKIIGIGAGVGFVLGKVLDKNTTVTTILGAVGGYLYSRTRDKGASEAVLKRGAKLGVVLTAPVSYADYSGYAPYRQQYLRS